MSFSTDSSDGSTRRNNSDSLLSQDYHHSSHPDQFDSHRFRKPKGTFLLTSFQFYLLLVVFIAMAVLAFLGWILHDPCDRSAVASTPTVSYGPSYEIGLPPVLPAGDWAKFNILHMNDVYELLPLSGRGGLARVATIRQMMLDENDSLLTTLGGDLVSPSALGTTNMTTIDNKLMNGRQMVYTMNALGLDVATFGNHEFDESRADLLQRLAESKFQWISLNVIDAKSGAPFGNVPTFVIKEFDGVRILLFGLTINSNRGSGNYVNITANSEMIKSVESLIASQAGKFDVCIGLTHLELVDDIDLVESIPAIDAILGGHDHQDYLVERGNKFTPIFKADDNTFSVFILRMAFNRNPKATPKLLIHATLTHVNADFPDEPETAKVADYWFNLGMDAFKAEGFDPTAIVTTLPVGVVLDGRTDVVRAKPTLLTESICQAMLYTAAPGSATIGLFNTGAIRIDDYLSGSINQYDILRTLPYGDKIVTLKVLGSDLMNVLHAGYLLAGNPMFLSYCNVTTIDGFTWFDGVGVPIQPNDSYMISTGFYISTHIKDFKRYQIQNSYVTNTRALINYLPIQYPSPSSNINSIMNSNP